jgi:hypothetical protein
LCLPACCCLLLRRALRRERNYIKALRSLQNIFFVRAALLSKHVVCQLRRPLREAFREIFSMRKFAARGKSPRLFSRLPHRFQHTFLRVVSRREANYSKALRVLQNIFYARYMRYIMTRSACSCSRRTREKVTHPERARWWVITASPSLRLGLRVLCSARRAFPVRSTANYCAQYFLRGTSRCRRA